jgi:predicted DNA-binding transcriptional regulator AlpA
LVEWSPTTTAKEVRLNNKVHAEWISISEVQEILGIGRTKAYELVR